MGWNYGWHRFERFERKAPRAAKGGIKAQSQRGQFGQSWWAKRWIAVLEAMGDELGGRLSRGRSYARNGQVLNIEITKGRVTAEVQGSRPKPYKVSIAVDQIPEAGWKKVIEALSRQAIFAAKLMAGEMPQDIEAPFAECGVPLLPMRRQDLKTECSCPDYSNPCKHVAAVYYLIGEEFDRDPFLIFRLRGMDRDDILKQLGGRTATAPQPAPRVEETQPIPLEAAAFWGVDLQTRPEVGSLQPPPVAAALPKRLGSFPFWRAEERFLDAMEAIYTAASDRAEKVVAGSVVHNTSHDAVE